MGQERPDRLRKQLLKSKRRESNCLKKRQQLWRYSMYHVKTEESKFLGMFCSRTSGRNVLVEVDGRDHPNYEKALWPLNNLALV